MIEERGIQLDLELEDEPTKDSDVFYNEDMQINRDISVAALQVYRQRREEDRKLKVLDALGGSGIRGIRYLQAIDGLKVTINDANSKAVENARNNLERNELEAEVTNSDANVLMADRYHAYDVVDIDPFGSPVDFTDPAARCLSHEGFAMFTATDLATLCGSYIKTCKRRYASWSRNTSYCHELGLRILIKYLFESFARFNKVFRPKLAFAQKHYYRVVGEVRESKKGVNRTLHNIGFLEHCSSCAYRNTVEDRDYAEPTCPECGDELEKFGPLWIGKLGRKEFCAEVIEVLEEKGYNDALEIVELLHDEIPIKTPYYDTHKLAEVTGKPAPSRDRLLDDIQDRGYEAVRTHFAPTGIRTNCPLEIIQEMLQ